MSKNSVRDLILQALIKIENDEAYSNLLVNSIIEQNKLNEKDIGLFTEVVYGTVQRKKTLDFYLDHFLLKKPKKRDEWILSLLRMSFYQMVYLDRIPDHAVIFEAVQLAKKNGHRGLANLVNGILRNAQRKGFPDVNQIKDDLEKLSIKYSHPQWLVTEWIKQYGHTTTQAICKANLVRPNVTARVNKTKATPTEVIERLSAEGVVAKQGNLANEAIQIQRGNLFLTETFKQGYVTAQDESSMLVARAVNPQKDEKILDSCAAPGGKTTHLAELMDTSGQITALDIHKHKALLIKEQSDRLQMENIDIQVGDAREAGRLFPEETFDRILIDAPCSGFGVIRKKPDIKWVKTNKDVAEITQVQKAILEATAPLLKKGGTLVYSTCTIEQRENEQIVADFLETHRNFSFDEQLKERLPKELSPYFKQGQIQILPHYFQSDGFYIAAMKKH